MELVYIIVLNYNGWQDTIECLESIFAQTYDNFKIIIVDNCSINNSVVEICEIFKSSFRGYNLILVNEDDIETFTSSKSNYSDDNQVILIKSNINKGYAFGNNLGIRFALKDPLCNFVWILNNDTVLYNNSLEIMLFSDKWFVNNTGFLGSKLVYYNNPNIIQGFGGKLNNKFGTVQDVGEGKDVSTILDKTEIDYPIGASIMLSREMIEKVGLLCDEYFLFYEELDYCQRAKRLGYNFSVESKCLIKHKHAASTQANKFKSIEIDLISLRSRIIFMKKYFSYNMPYLYFSFILIILKRILKGQFLRSFRIGIMLFNV